MFLLTIAVIILIGIFLLLVEFFIIPGFTVAGIGGFVFVVFGVICAYIFQGAFIGNITVLSTALLLSIIFWRAFKSGTWKKMGLGATITGKIAGNNSQNIQAGISGHTLSKLSPIGNAIINDTIFEVRSQGEYINSNTDIEVMKVEGKTIIVRAKTNP